MGSADRRSRLSGSRLGLTAWLRIARWCGIVPFAIGLLIFAAWLLLDGELWVIMGIMTAFVAGPIVVGIGTICLANYAYRAHAAKLLPGRRLLRQTLAVLGLYGLNFVTAGAIMVAVVSIMSLYTVRVTNHGPTPLENIAITAPGVEKHIAMLPPGASVTRSFWPSFDEGEIRLTATQAGQPLDAVLESYSGGQRCLIVADVNAAGEVKVVPYEGGDYVGRVPRAEKWSGSD